MDILKLFRLYDYRKIMQLASWSMIRSVLSYVRRSPTAPLPVSAIIDISNTCNLRCPMCPTGTHTLGRKPRLMALDEFKKVLDEIPTLKQISLFNWGEPLLNNNLLAMIRYAKQKQVIVNVHSNFSLQLSRDFLTDLVQSGLDYLVLSVDGFYQESYAKYRYKGDIEQVKDNLLALVEIKRNLGSVKPDITWKFLENKFNWEEIPLARDFCKQHGLHFTLQNIQTHAPVDSLPKKRFYDEPENWLTPEQIGMEKDFSSFDTHCTQLWFRIVINSDLGVSPCCYVSRSESDFGNLNTVSPLQIWNNEIFQSSRALFSKRRTGFPVGKDNPCAECTIYKKPAKKRTWGWRLNHLLRQRISSSWTYNRIRRLHLVSLYMLNRVHEDDHLLFRHFSDNTGLFIDVGANGGQSAISFSSVNKSMRIISFEANTEMSNELIFIKKILKERFSFHMFGLGKETSELQLIVPELGGLALNARASLQIDNEELFQKELEKEMGGEIVLSRRPVSIRCFDELNLRPDWIKIDVEGYEESVLVGMKETIENCRPCFMIERSASFESCQIILRNLNYRLFQYYPASDTLKEVAGWPDRVNYFAIPEDKLPNFQKIGLLQDNFC